MANNKVCLLIIYFGSFNNYFDLWLSSARQCSKIDFYVITDNNIGNDKLGNNVFCINETLDSIKKKASSVLGFECSIDTPYKLCDYKPFYNLLFPEICNKYDYWGYGDIDLIYGDLNKLFEIKLFERYLVILKLGHLSFIKNDARCDLLNLIDKNVIRKVYSSNESFYFDERKYSRFTLLRELYPDLVYDDYSIIADISPVYSFLWPPEEQYKKLIPQRFIFEKRENGQLIGYYIDNNELKEKEFIYIHLIKRSMRNKLKSPPLSYFIVPCRFLIHNKPIRISSFNRLSKCDKISLIFRLRKRIHNKIKKVFLNE